MNFESLLKYVKQGISYAVIKYPLKLYWDKKLFASDEFSVGIDGRTEALNDKRVGW